jgi:hypothetical protein
MNMSLNTQRTFLPAMMALAMATGSAMAAAPEKDPGQQQPASAQPSSSMQQPTSAQPSSSMQRSTPTPADTASSISAAAYEKFDALDANHDGSIDQQEANASKALKTQFSKLDTNSDSKLSMTEFNNASNMAAIRVDNKGKGY